MEVSLEELYKGCERDLRYEQDIVCRSCRGRGATRLQSCRTCHGRGVVLTRREVMPGSYMQMQRTCPDCNGAGATVPPGAVCNDCRGAGILQQQVHLAVKVPPGAPNQFRTVFKGKADEAPDMEAGDIIVEVREKPHTTFKRLGDNLLADRRVSLLDALTGVRFRLRHLDGTDIEISCPPGEVVRPGEIWTIKARGMPSPKRPGSRGDLLVRFEVDFPAKLPSDASREQLRPLLDPKAPADVTGSTSSGSRWSGIFGSASSGATPVIASRAGPQKAREVAEALAAQEREAAHGTERGGQRAECAQM